MADGHVTKDDFNKFEQHINGRFDHMEQKVEELEKHAITEREANVLHAKWKDADTRMTAMEVSQAKFMGSVEATIERKLGEVKESLASQVGAVKETVAEKVGDVKAITTRNAAVATVILGIVMFLLQKFV